VAKLPAQPGAGRAVSPLVTSTAVRVVAGVHGGRRLVAPEGRDTRPTSDRVRAAMFNALASLDVLRDATVLDLFAGSGALGIEALSRGAATCTFVEVAKPALKALGTNIDALGLQARSEIVTTDASRFVVQRPGPWDLVLADPAYSFDGWPDLLRGLHAGLVVAEAGVPVAAPDGWVTVRERAYGGSVVTFLQPAG
jgi:16S rRNA (guanine966-N2)-methyltransferase